MTGRVDIDNQHLDGHKLYWHLDRVHQWKREHFVSPIYLEISPVSYCNHNCLFCAKDFARVDRHALDTVPFTRRLTEMGQLGVKSVMFAGEGEPLLHKDLPLLVATAKQAGIDVSITTNGSLGHYELWQELLPRLTWLRFSLDAGEDQTYARVHGVSQSTYAQTLQSISDAVRAKQEQGLRATLGVQFLVLPENENSVEPAILTLQELGVDYLALKPYSRHPKMLKDKEVVYRRETFEQLAELVRRHQDGSQMRIVFRRESMVAYTGQEKKFTHCRALPFGGYICANGDFYSCSTFIGDFRFLAGNLNQQDMEEILFGLSRRATVELGLNGLHISNECRVNCRMARVNEFLEMLTDEPEHVNFI